MHTLLLLGMWPSPTASVAIAGPVGEHARQMAIAVERQAPRPSPGPMPSPSDGPDAIVYGYQAYWAADLEAIPWDDLSHVALFAAEAGTDGSLTGTSNWDDAADAVAMATPYGVRVHLCVINFDTDELEALLGSETARAALIDALAAAVEETGAHGVNVDFEGLPSSRREEMVDFVRDLQAVVDEVVLATPAVDWSDAWDYAALTDYADLFIMGYGYHWSGSSHAGPVDPLYGGDPWSSWSLSTTVEDYLDAGADPDRVILGLPLYGYQWTTEDDGVPSVTTATGSSITWAKAAAGAAANGRLFEEVSRTPWYWDGSKQTWYGDADSIQERIAYAIDAGIGGIGFWALHYDGGDEDLWQVVREETVLPKPDGSSDDYVADAGPPFLAYPGDTVVLSGAGSEGPAGVELVFRWSQLSGPEGALDDPNVMEPSFPVEAPGVAVFELLVGDGTTWSEPARSYVVVLDPEAGERFGGKGCGCSAAPGFLGAVPLLGLLALVRRRR